MLAGVSERGSLHSSHPCCLRAREARHLREPSHRGAPRQELGSRGGYHVRRSKLVRARFLGRTKSKLPPELPRAPLV